MEYMGMKSIMTLIQNTNRSQIRRKQYNITMIYYNIYFEI